MKLYKQKIVSISDILKIIQTVKHYGKNIVLANGVFDLCHAGHVLLLWTAKYANNKPENNILIVALNSDKSVKYNKGNNRPIIDYESRSILIASLDPVDYVISFNEKSVLSTIKLVKPDILVKGSEYSEKGVVGSEFVKSYGGSILRVNMKEGISTSNIIEKIKLEN